MNNKLMLPGVVIFFLLKFIVALLQNEYSFCQIIQQNVSFFPLKINLPKLAHFVPVFLYECFETCEGLQVGKKIFIVMILYSEQEH